MKHEPLEFGRYYHIYNHGVGHRDIFPLDENYEYFLELYIKYIVPIAETFAWALMKNHFHILLRLKDVEEIYPGLKKSFDPTCLGNLTGLRNNSTQQVLETLQVFERTQTQQVLETCRVFPERPVRYYS